jgi:hypothetical protein
MISNLIDLNGWYQCINIDYLLDEHLYVMVDCCYLYQSIIDFCQMLWKWYLKQPSTRFLIVKDLIINKIHRVPYDSNIIPFLQFIVDHQISSLPYYRRIFNKDRQQFVSDYPHFEQQLFRFSSSIFSIVVFIGHDKGIPDILIDDEENYFTFDRTQQRYQRCGKIAPKSIFSSFKIEKDGST